MGKRNETFAGRASPLFTCQRRPFQPGPGWGPARSETDAGTQTRMFYFGAPQKQGDDWQGISKASWELTPAVGGFSFGGAGQTEGTGSLKVVTTRLKPGYLRKNGVPYSANTTLTEYYDLVKEPDGDLYLVITTTVEDPTYLTEPYLTNTHFRKQADATGWNPTPCTAK